MPLSNPQFGGSDSSYEAQSPSVNIPLSLSSSTMGSTAQATAWTTRSLSGGRPLSLSKKTRGTTFNWDDSASQPSVPQSDKGAGRE
jgi:hypothetical protein